MIYEFNLYSIIILHVSDGGRVAGFGRELGLLGVQRVPPRRELVAVRRIEELGVSLIEVIGDVSFCNVSEVEELEELGWLVRDRIEVDADLLGDRVLRARIVQQLLFRYCLRLLVSLVKAESCHDRTGE